MAVRDILLTLTSYPDPTPVSVIDRAVSLATALDAHLAAISCEVHIQVPGSLISFGAARAVSGRFESVFGYGGFSNCCKSDSIFAISSGEDEYGKGLFDGLENSGCGLGRGRREPA
jgi:hypothetical protein